MAGALTEARRGMRAARSPPGTAPLCEGEVPEAGDVAPAVPTLRLRQRLHCGSANPVRSRIRVVPCRPASTARGTPLCSGPPVGAVDTAPDSCLGCKRRDARRWAAGPTGEATRDPGRGRWHRLPEAGKPIGFCSPRKRHGMAEKHTWPPRVVPGRAPPGRVRPQAGRGSPDVPGPGVTEPAEICSCITTAEMVDYSD